MALKNKKPSLRYTCGENPNLWSFGKASQRKGKQSKAKQSRAEQSTGSYGTEEELGFEDRSSSLVFPEKGLLLPGRPVRQGWGC
jgi:hypothetical protein